MNDKRTLSENKDKQSHFRNRSTRNVTKFSNPPSIRSNSLKRKNDSAFGAIREEDEEAQDQINNEDSSKQLTPFDMLMKRKNEKERLKAQDTKILDDIRI